MEHQSPDDTYIKLDIEEDKHVQLHGVANADVCKQKCTEFSEGQCRGIVFYANNRAWVFHIIFIVCFIIIFYKINIFLSKQKFAITMALKELPVLSAPLKAGIGG